MNPTDDQESRDAELVNKAAEAIAEGRPKPAERMLLEVILRTPAAYANEEDDGEGGLRIRFWDVQDFVHYVAWQNEHGPPRNIAWVLNAYPRAYYYLGFLGVRAKTFPQAIDYLRRGQTLEPTHPRFKLELGQALVRSGDLAGALAQFDEVREMGPYVGARDVATARRGRGFVLIEQGRLDEAEAAFRASLELQPGNEIATNELAYIDQLRRGGRPTHTEVVQVGAPDLQECLVCNRQISQGKLVMFKGFARTVCESCAAALAEDESPRPAKQWWEFWR